MTDPAAIPVIRDCQQRPRVTMITPRACRARQARPKNDLLNVPVQTCPPTCRWLGMAEAEIAATLGAEAPAAAPPTKTPPTPYVPPPHRGRGRPRVNAEDIFACVELGARVYEARKALGLTMHQLAQRAGIGRTTVQQTEAGEHASSYPVLLRLARALGVSLDWLAGREGA